MRTREAYLNCLIKDIQAECKQDFIHHQTTIRDLGRLQLIEFCNPQRPYYCNLKYIFDRRDATLYLDGDFGSTTFKFYSRNTTFWDLTNFANNLGYFMEKEVNPDISHQHDSQLAVIDMQTTLNDFFDNEVPEDVQQDFNDLVVYGADWLWVNGMPDPDALEQFQNLMKVDSLDDEIDYGRRLSGRGFVWQYALTTIRDYPITFIPQGYK